MNERHANCSEWMAKLSKRGRIAIPKSAADEIKSIIEGSGHGI